MTTQRVSLGFDLRLNPELQGDYFWDQHLVPELPSPISADSNVWLETAEINSLVNGLLPDDPMRGTMPEFCNPLFLAKDLESLLDACGKQGISTTGLFAVCLTSSEANVVALAERYGPGYFEDQLGEGELLSRGWQPMGFDVVDLNGLISGLKGCGYKEPAWSQLRKYFRHALNEVGLFRDCLAASQFAEVRGLQIHEHAPFVVVGVLVKGQT